MTARTLCMGGNQGRGDPPATRHAMEPAWPLKPCQDMGAPRVRPLSDLTAQLRPPEDRRSWYIEFDCDGWPAYWRGYAATEAGAEAAARAELAYKHADFDREGARLVVCLEQ